MIQTAEILTESQLSVTPVLYEQPLSERMRTLLRLEYLYQQFLFQADLPAQNSSRVAVTTILDIISILNRGDVRSDILKELERQLYMFDRYQDQPGVNKQRLQKVLVRLQSLRHELIAVGPKYLQPLRDCEFLSAIKHRSAIPGGTCEFDLPDYSHWCRKPHEQRVSDIEHWMKTLRPLCNSASELLWLVRESGQPSEQVASNGVYLHTFDRDSTAALLRVTLPPGVQLYPEISGSHHRFTVRFMHWPDVRDRSVQINKDIGFTLTIC